MTDTRRIGSLGAVAGVLLLAGGCGLLDLLGPSPATQPKRPERAVRKLREELRRHVTDPEALGALDAHVDAVEQRIRRQTQRIAELEARLAELEPSAERAAAREAARIEIHGLTGFSTCAGDGRESGLEAHVRAVDGNDNETRVNGTFEFFLVRSTRRLLLTREQVERTWRRRAHSKRTDPARGVFSHYVYCLPCPKDYRTESGLRLKVRLTTESGATLEAERELKPAPAQ